MLLSIGCFAVGQEPNTAAMPPTKQESPNKSPCKQPKVVYSPEPLPPASWGRKGPKSATTLLAVTVDKKGKVHDPAIVESGGADVDKQAIQAVRQWRFDPAICGTDRIETKIQVRLIIILQ